MEQEAIIKLLEERISLITDRVRALQGRAEEFLFRAQHIANALKNGFPVRDRTFGDDLQLYRKEVKIFSTDVLELPNLLARLERDSRYDPLTVKPAQSLFRSVSHLQKEMRQLQATAGLAHQHIRQSAFKVESTYLGLELEKMTQKTDLLPQTANKVLLIISSPEGLG